MHWNSTPQVGKLDFELESWAILSSKKRDGKRQPREFEHLKGMLLGYCLWFTQVPPKHDSALVSSQISTSVRHVWMHSPLPNFHNFAVQSEDAVRTYLNATHRNANACSRLGLNDRHPKTCCTIQASNQSKYSSSPKVLVLGFEHIP